MVEMVPHGGLLPSTIEIAERHGVTLHDAVYVALARRRERSCCPPYGATFRPKRSGKRASGCLRCNGTDVGGGPTGGILIQGRSRGGENGVGHSGGVLHRSGARTPVGVRPGGPRAAKELRRRGESAVVPPIVLSKVVGLPAGA